MSDVFFKFLADLAKKDEQALSRWMSDEEVNTIVLANTYASISDFLVSNILVEKL